MCYVISGLTSMEFDLIGFAVEISWVPELPGTGGWKLYN